MLMSIVLKKEQLTLTFGSKVVTYSLEKVVAVNYSSDFRNVRNKHFAGRTVKCEHIGTLSRGSGLKHAPKGGSSAMKAGCCGADQKALISLLGSSLAPDP